MKHDRRWMTWILDHSFSTDVALPWARGQQRTDRKARRKLRLCAGADALASRG